MRLGWLIITFIVVLAIAALAGCTRARLRLVPPPPDAGHDAGSTPPSCSVNVATKCWPPGQPATFDDGGTPLGHCKLGHLACVADHPACIGWIAAAPVDDCSGQDVDCDGIVNDISPHACWKDWIDDGAHGPMPRQALLGECHPGWITCGGCVGAQLPQPPACGRDATCTGTKMAQEPFEAIVVAAGTNIEPDAVAPLAGALIIKWAKKHPTVESRWQVWRYPPLGAVGPWEEAAQAGARLLAPATSTTEGDEPEVEMACMARAAAPWTTVHRRTFLVTDDSPTCTSCACISQLDVITADVGVWAGWVRSTTDLSEPKATLDEVLNMAGCDNDGGP